MGKRLPKTQRVKVLEGQIKQFERDKRPLPNEGGVKRYIVTSAQNATSVHPELWDNLLTLALHYDAEIMVSRFRYVRNAPIAKQSEKPGEAKAMVDPEYFDPAIWRFICDKSVELAPGLVFCGELQISPTAVNPLAGMDGYTGRSSSIIPHTKQFMHSVASGKNEGTKLIYSTGTVTMRNYIEARAGQKASFHHIYGALLVEVCDDGTWFVRQLQADSEGTVHDLDLKVHDGVLTAGNSIEAVVWGDTHVAEIDPAVAMLAYGSPDCMIDTLKPRYQFQHDVFDFRAANVHNIKRGLHHAAYRDWIKGHRSVSAEIKGVMSFLKDTASRPWCETVVVNSNHDNMLQEWLRVGEYRKDPANARVYLKAETFMYDCLTANPDRTPPLLRYMTGGTGTATFLAEDESFIICRDANGGIECGMHGHFGPNGARGSLRSFAKMGRKCIVGHSHSAGIFEGAWQVGLSGKMDQGYNSGPSSWSHSHALVYPNGKRAMVTMYNSKWRA